jgi:hypothetical protein
MKYKRGRIDGNAEDVFPSTNAEGNIGAIGTADMIDLHVLDN